MTNHNGLINRTELKRYILRRIEARRPHLAERFTRVSGAATGYYEAQLKIMIDRDIDAHPTVGKTFRPEGD